jgi:hypothetical protein
MTDDVKYFYLWQHRYHHKTCFGKTEDLAKRKIQYNGHNGYDIDWSFLVRGSGADIDKLEYTLKKKLNLVEQDLGEKITYGHYEWIEAQVEYKTIEALMLNFLAEDNYDSVSVLTMQSKDVLDSEEDN